MIVRTIALALALLAPVAIAQAPFSSVIVTADPFEGPAPLSDPIAADVEARISCVPLARAGGPTKVSFALGLTPAWADLRLDPTETTFEMADCHEGVAIVRTQVWATSNGRAPAFTEDHFEIIATVDTGGYGNLTAGVMASYRGAVTAWRQTPDRPVEPGGIGEFWIRLSNGGNGGTRVDLVAIEAPALLAIEPPAPAHVGSVYDHGRGSSTSWGPFRVRVAADAALGADHVVNVTFQPSSEERPSMLGDLTTATFVVRVREAVRASVPLPIFELLSAALLAGAALRRRSP